MAVVVVNYSNTEVAVTMDDMIIFRGLQREVGPALPIILSMVGVNPTVIYDLGVDESIEQYSNMAEALNGDTEEDEPTKPV